MWAWTSLIMVLCGRAIALIVIVVIVVVEPGSCCHCHGYCCGRAGLSSSCVILIHIIILLVFNL